MMGRFLLLVLCLALVAAARPIDSGTLYNSLMAYHDKRVPSVMRHETEAQREERLRWIAESVVQACEQFPLDAKLGWTRDHCIALATTMAKWESGLVKEVHEGTKKGPSGELCLFQIHRGVANIPDPVFRTTEAERLATVGLSLEATQRCALAGVKTIAWQVHRCGFRAKDFLAASQIFSHYHWPGVKCELRFDQMSSYRAGSYRTLLTSLTKAPPLVASGEPP